MLAVSASPSPCATCTSIVCACGQGIALLQCTMAPVQYRAHLLAWDVFYKGWTPCSALALLPSVEQS